jgi:hypothetical protein
MREQILCGTPQKLIQAQEIHLKSINENSSFSANTTIHAYPILIVVVCLMALSA